MQAKFPNGLSMNFISGALTATGGEALYDTTVAMIYTVNGKLYTKGTVANGAAILTDINTGLAFLTLNADKGCVFLWMLDAAGLVVVAQGGIQPLDSESAAPGTFLISPQFPAFDPDTYCPFAYMVAKVDGTGSGIVFGTSFWNDTGFTNVIQNISTVPSRPQIA